MQLPKGKSLYDVLEIEKHQVDKDIAVIKKAYRRLALQYHPDKQHPKKQTEGEDSTQQFQLVGFAYSILNDPAKRKHYDLTGSLDGDDSFLSGDKDWTDYFKELWQGVVSEETIVAHASKYQGSDEELQDVLKYYTNCKGNMDHVLAHVEHSKATDVPRFIIMINTAIKDKSVSTYPAFAKTTTKAAQRQRIRKEEKEHAEATKKETANNKDEDDGLDSLRAMMKARQEQRKSDMDDMLATMEEKATSKRPAKQTKRKWQLDDNDETTRKKASKSKKNNGSQ